MLTDKEIAIATANDLVQVGPELSGMPRRYPNYWVYIGKNAVTAPLAMTKDEAEEEAKVLRKSVTAAVLAAIHQAKGIV